MRNNPIEVAPDAGGNGHLSYRADIDGLRAIAVLAIVLFHIDKEWIPGGFVGVDIFFVISGYLITGIILKSAKDSKFSYLEFYRRRVLRIFPALAVCIFFTLLIGQLLLLPGDLVKLVNSAVASVFSLANVYFTYFLDTSYFSRDSELQPLLHLWSLGVEEQYYLLWPFLFLGLLKINKYFLVLAIPLLLIVLSIVFAEVNYEHSQMFTYYMLPSRAAELLIGSVLAIWVGFYGCRFGLISRNIFACVGIILICFSFVYVDESKSFPGVNALPSTVGTAFLIFSGGAGTHWFTTFLSSRWIVLVGLVSYSMYLWHWPILAYVRYVYGEIDTLGGLLALLVIFLISFLSYRYVEVPTRKLTWNFKRSFLSFGVVVSLCVVGFSFFVIKTNGYGFYVFSDYPDKLAASAKGARPAYEYSYVCQAPKLKRSQVVDEAYIVNSLNEPSVLLWGDSHAAHYVGVISKISEKANFGFRNFAHSSCAPLIKHIERNSKPERRSDCKISNAVVVEELDKYSTILMGGSWISYFGVNDSFLEDLRETIVALTNKGKKVIILGQVPRMPALDRECQSKSIKAKFIDCRSQSRVKDLGEYETNIALMNLVSEIKGAEYFGVREFICDKGHCSGYQDGELIYYDEGHLSMDGSWMIGERVVQALGVPEQFRHLVNDGGLMDVHHGNLSKYLSERTKNRFSELINSGSEIDLSVVLTEGSGHANAALGKGKESGFLKLIDKSDDSFQFLEFSVDPSLKSINQREGQAISLAVEIDAAQGVFPLIRIMTGDRVYDAILDTERTFVKAKRNLKKDRVYLDKVGNRQYKLYIQAPIDASEPSVRVRVYPSASLEFPGYSKEAIGAVKVLSISYFIGKW